MKHIKKLGLTTLGLAALSIASANDEAKANETQPTEPATSTIETKTEKVEITKEQVDNAKAEVTNQETVVAEKVKQNSEAETTVKEAEDAVTKADNKVKELEEATATPKETLAENVTKQTEVVANAENTKAEKEAVVNETKTNLDTKTESVNSKQEEVTNQELIVNEKQKLVETLTNPITEEEINNARTDVTHAQNAADKAKDVQNKAQTELTKAEEADKVNADAVKSASETLASKTTNVNDAQNTVTEKEAKVKAAEQKVKDETIHYTHDIALLPEWKEMYDAYNAILDEPNEVMKAKYKQYKGIDESVELTMDQVMEAYAYQRERAKPYRMKLFNLEFETKEAVTYDTERTDITPPEDVDNYIVDPNNLSEADKMELNELVITYINNVRKQLGRPEVKLNLNEKLMAEEIAKKYVERNNPDIFAGHYDKGINEVAAARKLQHADVTKEKSAQLYENLTNFGYLKDRPMTKRLIFKEVMDNMRHFLFESNQGYGHAYFLYDSDNHKADSFGVALSFVEDPENPWNTIRVHIIGVGANAPLQDDGTVGSIDEVADKYVQYSAEGDAAITVTPKDPTKAKAELATAKAELTQAEQNLASAQAEKQNAQNTLDELNKYVQQTPQAREKLNGANNALAIANSTLTDKQNTLNVLTSVRAEREALLNNAKTELQNETQTLNNLKAELEVKQNELKDAQTQYDNAVSVLNEANDALSEAKTTLTKEQEKYDAYDTNIAKLEEARKEKETAETNLENARASLESTSQALVDAETKLREAINKYNKLSELYDLEQSLKLSTNDEGDIFGVPRTAPTAKELPKYDINKLLQQLNSSIAVAGANATIDETKSISNSDYGVDAQSERKSRVNNTNNKVLPNTGDTTKSATVMGITILALAAGLVGRKRKI